jgi:hypothetical protein
MKYPVIKNFRDKYTKIRYKIGDIYETEDAKRAEYLQSKNALGEQIDKPADKPEPGTKPESVTAQHDTIEPIKPIGGGWYELPDGTRIQGRENAEKALSDTAENASSDSENALNGGEKA